VATSSFPLFIIYLIFKDNCFFKLKKKGYTSIRTTNELLGPFERILVAIVFKPGFVVGPVQGPGSRFWPGHRVGWVNLYFKKIQNYVVLIKKKKSQWVAIEFCQVNPSGRPDHTGSWFFLFFHQFGLVPVAGRPTRPGFKTMLVA
jgi:hypothetical protein